MTCVIWMQAALLCRDRHSVKGIGFRHPGLMTFIIDTKSILIYDGC
jgi:hypothetical protein